MAENNKAKTAINTVFRDNETAKPANLRLHKCEEISIEVTNECCMQCAHCSSLAGKPFPRELTIQEMKDLITVGHEELGTEVVSLSGGEPLLREGIEEVVRHIRKLGLKLLVYTCGNYPVKRLHSPGWVDIVGYGMFTRNMVEDRIRVAMDSIDYKAKRKNTSIIFSIEGLELTHDGLAGRRGAFANMMMTADYCIRSSMWANVEAHFTPTKMNFRQLPDVYEHCIEAGFDKFSILRLVPQGECLNHLQELLMNKKEFLELLEIMNEMKSSESEKTPIRIGDPCVWGFFWDKSIKRNCNAGINRILIRANGEAQFCAALKHAPNYDYGNVLETPLKELWDNSKMALTLRKLHYGIIRVEPCYSHCKFYENCMGGCTSQRIAANGDLRKGPDPLCVKNLIEKRRNKREAECVDLC